MAGPEYRKLYASLDEARQHYYGAITAMDEQIGRLRAELRRLGIEQNTIIIFTSDNGPSGPVTKKGIASAGPFRGHKHTMYEGGLRVPTVIEWPGHVTAGRTSDVATATVDIFLTVVDLTGAKLTRRLTRPIDGVSRKALLAGSTEERSAPLFFGYRRLVSDIDGQALVENRYKLVRSASPGGGYQLFDLLEDPSEKNDLAKTKPEIFNRMRATMAQYDESCRLSRDGADYEH